MVIKQLGYSLVYANAHLRDEEITIGARITTMIDRSSRINAVAVAHSACHCVTGSS
eukprot:COSAG06_NODE_49300_length_326_cov_0.911894_1_plen_55_part_01